MSDAMADELAGIDLGGERSNERSKHLLEAFAANPEASIDAASDGWGGTVAAYRSFDDEAVSPEEILRPHREATLRRMGPHPVVSVVQDTTGLDYTRHPPRDARCLDEAGRFGPYSHLHLAVTPDESILGVVGLDHFDGDPQALGKSNERSPPPIEEEESFRWPRGYRLACQLAADSPGTRIVGVAGREGGIYDIFVDAQQEQGSRADYVTRARVDRRTPGHDLASGPAVFHEVRAEVGASRLLTTRTLELGETPKRKARTARSEIRAQRSEVKPPHERSHLPSVTMDVVLVEEVGGPGDDTGVSRLLLTRLPIGTAEEVPEVIDHYAARWAVEVYDRTWKTGCRVEEIQPGTQARLEDCLAMHAIVAWRVSYLTYLNRTCPRLPCTVVSEEGERKSVWLVVAKLPLPKEPPGRAEMMRLLTQLGGYDNRAGEPPAGPQPLWIGLRRMADFSLAWQTFGNEP